MPNVTDLINGSVVGDQAKAYGEEAIKKLIFFSGIIVRWITDQIAAIGLSIPEQSITAGLVIVFVILLIIVLKFVEKVVLKVALVLAIVWFIAGFFVVPT